MARIAIDFDVNDAQAVAALNRIKGSIGSIQPPHPATEQGFTSIKDRILEVTGVAQKMARVLVSVQVLMASVVAGLGIKQIIETADAWTNMASRLSLVTQSSADLLAVQDRLFRLAQEIRLPIEDVVKLYTRLAQNSQELGVNQIQLFAITKATSQAMQISGATAGEAASGVLQFTQAIASNNLAGDELKALLENSPRLIKAVGDGLRLLSPEFDKLTKSGMSTIGAIRALAKKGQMDAGLILEAVLSQMKVLDTEFGHIVRTIGQAWTQIMNQLQQGIKGVNTKPLLDALDRVRAWFADPSTQASIHSFADGILSALGAMADKIPAIVAFIQGHVASLAVDIQTLSPLLNPIGEWLSKITKEFLSLPPGIQEFGLIVALLFGMRGVGVAILAMDVGSQLGIVYNGLKQIMGLYDPDQEASLVRARGLIEELKKAETSFNDRDFLAPPRDFRQEGGTTRLEALLKEQADEAAALAAGIKRNAATNNDAARIAAAKRLEEAMKVAKLVNDIHLDQSQFEKDQAVKTTDFVMHENKRKYDNYEQSEADFIATELVLLQERNDQELKFLEESAKNVKADLALKLRAITAHAADKKNLEDPGLTKIKINEAELQAFKQTQDLKQKGLDITRQTEDNKVKIVEAAEDRITKMVAEASGARSQREIDDIDLALKQVERGSNAEIALYAEKLKKIQGFNRQIIDDAADLATEQARLAGDINLAYSVGFAEAAVKADSAFTVMRKSGAEAFGALKSGLSDFLFDMLTGAKTIGDVFVNLGKRILRSMTDAFAEILAKQIAMAAGFSLTGLLGTVGAAVAGTGSANDAAQGVTKLGAAATTSADSLSGMTGVLGLVMRALLFFANGLLGFLGFFGQIVSGIASGGGIVNTLTSAFGGLVKAGGALFSVFNGLQSVGSAIYNVFSTANGLANVFQATFDALGLTSGGFAGSAGIAGGEIGVTNAAGELATSFSAFIGQWVPIAGALYMAAMAIQNFFNGGTAVKIGTAIGLVLAGPFGAWLGGIIGGLFAPTPKSVLRASITPFDRNAIGSEVNLSPVSSLPGAQGTQVGAGMVQVGGNVLKTSKENALALVLAAALNDLLKRVVDATVLMIQTLPPTIGAQLDAALTAIETNGLIIEDFSHKGKKAGKRLQQHVESFMDDALQAMVEGLNFGAVDLKALGFDPKDPKGEKGGEVARGFNALMLALGGLSAIVKEVGPAVDLSSVSLAQFTKGAIDYFKSFAQEGEAFIDTVKRVMGSISGIVQVMEQNRALIAAATGDMGEAFGILVRQVQRADEQVIALADALTVAVESGAKPEDVLAAAQAVQQAIQAELQTVQQLKSAVDALNGSILGGVNLIVELTQKIDALSGTSLSAADFQVGLDGIVSLFNALTDITSRIALFQAGLVGAAENLSLLIANLPLAAEGFNLILAQIQQLENPAEAIAALKSLAGAVEAGLSAAVAAVNQQTQATIAGLNAQKSAMQQGFDLRKKALSDERAQIQKNNDAQRKALQEQLDLAQQWGSILTSVKSQLVDLFNLLAPTHPLTSLNDVRAQFEAAFAQFQANPTPELATQVQDLAKQVLQLAQQTPGFDLPSAAFQDLAAEVQVALEAIQTFAASQPTQEAIQAQIAALEEQQAASMASIDDKISALDASQASALASIDAQIQAAGEAGQAQIASLNAMAAQGLEAIRAQVILETEKLAQQQAKAAEALQAVLGDKTFEEFIAAKQAEAADLLRGIDKTLQAYLGAIITNLFPGVGVPQLAGGMANVPYDNFPALLHRGERVMTAAENRAFPEGIIPTIGPLLRDFLSVAGISLPSSRPAPITASVGQQGGGTKTVTITLAPTIQITGGGASSRMKDELDRALVEIVNGPSLTRPALLALAKRAS